MSDRVLLQRVAPPPIPANTGRRKAVASLQRQAVGNEATGGVSKTRRAVQNSWGFDFSKVSVQSGSQRRGRALPLMNAPGDAYELEADAVAGRVMGMASATSDATRHGGVLVQRKTSAEAEAQEAPSVSDAPLRSAGYPLDLDTRGFMEARFGYDFSQVRVHSGPEAEQSARDVSAQAYTVGNHIVFGPEQFRPGSSEGRRLIAHELTHVMQQRGRAGVMQRQPAPAKAPASRPDPAPGLGPLRTEDVQDLLNAKDYQGAIDALVHYKVMDYEIDLNLLKDKKMTFDPGLTSADGSTSMPTWDYLSTPQRAQPPKVRIGPGAVSSVSYLYAVIMHEYQHVLWQQTLPNQQESNLLHSQGFETPDEVRASAWELLHAGETGLGNLPEKVAMVWTNLNESFWKLDAKAQQNERPIVLRAFNKAKELMKGKGTLVPFSAP